MTRTEKILLAHVLQKPVEWVLLNPNVPRPAVFEDLKHQLDQGVPITRIIGQREFWSLPFFLSPATLDPRPDSETLIEAVMAESLSPRRILDLGTGSGCLLLALLSEYPDAIGVGVDINPDALKMAQKNAKNLGLSDRSTWVETSWTDGIDEEFDLIISNPPYISESEYEALDAVVKNYDPPIALKGGEDGLVAYRTIAAQVKKNLKGLLVLEIGCMQKEAVTHIFQEQGFILNKTHHDLSGHPRALVFIADSFFSYNRALKDGGCAS